MSQQSQQSQQQQRSVDSLVDSFIRASCVLASTPTPCAAFYIHLIAHISHPDRRPPFTPSYSDVVRSMARLGYVKRRMRFAGQFDDNTISCFVGVAAGHADAQPPPPIDPKKRWWHSFFGELGQKIKLMSF
jgi:hypothetical protein